MKIRNKAVARVCLPWLRVMLLPLFPLSINVDPERKDCNTAEDY